MRNGAMGIAQRGSVLKKQALLLTAVVGLSIGAAELRAAENFRMLVINQVGAWPHTGAINELKTRLNSLATAQNFGIKHVDANAAALMVADTLKNYDVMFWNNNTSIGAVITAGAPRNAFQAWLKEGHGLVAQHGVMDHADLWPWLTDSVLGGTRFTQHSGWNSSQGTGAKVKWDDLTTGGTEVRANKPEYAKIKANIPGSATAAWFTYPDEWYSFTINPRAKVDVLMRIDETTYDVPEKMGADHPIAWAYHLPPTTAGGKQGRFIYNARGHEAPAFSGTGSGAAPNDAWGTATSPTYNFIKYSICWAAGATGKIDEDCKPITTSIGSKSVPQGKMMAAARNGSLVVNVKGQGRFDVQVFDVAGQRVARKTGVEGEFAFPELKSGSMYIVKAKDGANRDHVQRVAF
jgi:type 1 glutamine amidotransferase